MSGLASFIAQKRRWHSFTDRDLGMAANGVILAMDGKIARADAIRCARMALESLGMQRVTTDTDGGGVRP